MLSQFSKRFLFRTRVSNRAFIHTSQFKRQKSGFPSKLLSVVFGAACGITVFGRPALCETDTAENDWKPQFLKDGISWYKGMVKSQTNPIRQQLLPDPNLDHMGHSQRTVIINLEKTLMCSKYTRDKLWTHMKRPCTDEFLKTLAQAGYEVVVFSTQERQMVMGMTQTIDPMGCVSHWLFKEHTSYEGGKHVKDLDLLGRDLRRVVMIDSFMDGVEKHKENTLLVKPFENEDRKDLELCKLIAFFKHLQREDVSDIRDVLRHFDAFLEQANRAEAEIQNRSRRGGIF
eukprot:49850_1